MLECGLGGRLDATNICKSKVGAITSIGFDHCEILGNSLEEICHEKAGIIRPNLEHIEIGNTVPHDILAAKCLETNCVLHRVNENNYRHSNTEIALLVSSLYSN